MYTYSNNTGKTVKGLLNDKMVIKQFELSEGDTVNIDYAGFRTVMRLQRGRYGKIELSAIDKFQI